MRTFLLICALFGLYSQIPFSIGDVSFPNVLGVAAGTALISVNLKEIQISHLNAMLTVCGVALLSIFIAPQFLTYLPDRTLAFAQLLVSMMTGYGFYLELRKRPAHYTSRLLTCFCAIILIGSVLEAFTPLRGAIQSLNSVFHPYDFQGQLERDLNIAGFARPIFFTSEPSHVAIGLNVLAISALILKPTRRMVLWTSGLLVLGLLIVRSPSIVIGFPMIFIVYWFAQRRHLHRFDRSRRSARALGLAILIGGPVAVAAFVLLADRIAEVSGGNDFSASIRLFASIKAGLDTAIRYPLSGVGLGGFEAAREIIIEALLISGVPDFIVYEFWDRMLNNGIGTHLMYFGFILLPIYIVAFYRMLKCLSAGNENMIILLMFCICLLTGGIYSPKFVFYYFLFAALAHVAYRSRLAETRRGKDGGGRQRTVRLEASGVC